MVLVLAMPSKSVYSASSAIVISMIACDLVLSQGSQLLLTSHDDGESVVAALDVGTEDCRRCMQESAEWSQMFGLVTAVVFVYVVGWWGARDLARSGRRLLRASLRVGGESRIHGELVKATNTCTSTAASSFDRLWEPIQEQNGFHETFIDLFDLVRSLSCAFCVHTLIAVAAFTSPRSIRFTMVGKKSGRALLREEGTSQRHYTNTIAQPPVTNACWQVKHASFTAPAI